RSRTRRHYHPTAQESAQWNQLLKKLHRARLSASEISEKFNAQLGLNLVLSTIKFRLKQLGLAALPKRTCDRCGATFQPRKSDQKRCGQSAHRTCRKTSIMRLGTWE